MSVFVVVVFVVPPLNLKVLGRRNWLIGWTAGQLGTGRSVSGSEKEDRVDFSVQRVLELSKFCYIILVIKFQYSKFGFLFRSGLQ